MYKVPLYTDYDYSQSLKFCVQVLIKRKKGQRSQAQMIPKRSSLKTLARSVGRRNRASIARQAMKDGKIREQTLNLVSKHIQKEMTALCSSQQQRRYEKYHVGQPGRRTEIVSTCFLSSFEWNGDCKTSYKKEGQAQPSYSEYVLSFCYITRIFI